MYPPENIKRQEEKGEWQCVDKVEELINDGIPSDKGIGDNVSAIAIVVWTYQ